MRKVLAQHKASTARSVQDMRGLGADDQPGGRPAEHDHLVPQREYLHVLGRRGPGHQREPGKHGHQQPVSQRDTRMPIMSVS
jgi:hypothetical protein